MINNVVLAAAAEDLGLHVTTDEVRRIVQTSPSFIDSEGKFSPIAFNNFAESEYGTPRSFIRSFTRSLLGQKLIQVFRTGLLAGLDRGEKWGTVSDWWSTVRKHG